jgi:hypothetical protein
MPNSYITDALEVNLDYLLISSGLKYEFNMRRLPTNVDSGPCFVEHKDLTIYSTPAF